jgi:predicted metal-binding protein
VKAVCLQVCTACGAQDDAGRRLYDALLARSAEFPEIDVRPVDCLAVCERPVTLAFQAAGGWTYIIGDADPVRDLDDILAAARAVAASPHGIPAMDDRPPFFRKGVIARVPPFGDQSP